MHNGQQHGDWTRELVNRLSRLVLISLTTILMVKSSTFGWNAFTETVRHGKAIDAELADRLKAHVYTLSHTIGNRSVMDLPRLESAAAYISQQLQAHGYTPEFEPYVVQDRHTKNVIGVKPGTSEEVVIVGAHYDTCFNPGADDNASGVAGLLELARSFAGTSTARTVKFIAFVNEEPPFFQTELMGSRVYAKAARARGEHIRAVVVLEMLGYYSDRRNSQRYPPLFGFGYPNRGNFIGVIGNFRSRRLIRSVAQSMRRGSSVPVESAALPEFLPGVAWSDHGSFWKEGYPAVMITDTAYLRNPHYHQDTDTLDTLNYQAMASVVEGLRAAIQDLAGAM